MSVNEAIRCPKCHNPVLESEYDAHIKSNHLQHYIKLDASEQKKVGGPSLTSEIGEMLKAFPRAFFTVLATGLVMGLVLEYYWLVR